MGRPRGFLHFAADLPQAILGLFHQCRGAGVFAAVTGVDATVAGWDEGQPWLDEILAQLKANRDWLAATIAAELPGVTLRLPEATYLAWLDCRGLEIPGSAGQFFLDHAKVGLNFGETFGAQYPGFARLNFATPAPVLKEIVGRMVDAVRQR